NLSEAVLTIDEPFPASGAVPASAQPVAGGAVGQLACQAINSSNCAINGVGAAGITLTGAGPVGANGPYNGTAGHYNVFQGFQNGVNSVAWLGVPIDAPGTNEAGQLNTRVIRITNVRANACLLGVSSTLIPTQIVMYISVNGSQQVTINNPQQTVAFIQPGLTVGNGTNSFAQCNNLNAYTTGLVTSSSSNGIAKGPTYITATEGFASSFKVRTYDQVINSSFTTPRTDASPSYQNVLGFPYNTESGFVSNATGLVSGGLGSGAVGLADTGTEITVAFTTIGQGVSVFVPSVIYLYPTGVSTSCSIASTGCTTAPTGVAILVGGTSGTTAIGGTNFGNVTVSSGGASVTYEVVQSNVNVLEALVVPVWTGFISNTTQSLPGLGSSSAGVNFAPLSASPTATTGPIPRFCQPHTAASLFTINICSCNLLFPFVTNQAGFDTGVAIANTSLDPFGTATQAGTVKLNYYGGTTGGGAAPAAQTSTVVAAGTELVFTLSNGGDHGVAATPGFQGYIIAQAQFQYCHAFAFISDLGAQRLAEGYLAIQLDIPALNRTGVFGEVQAH
ncbi:MAG: hypothetical protein JO022_10560, partial [Acidobacteriaceae bacterium]|nr:hypothetical protein [Acidobacteriaceae bacterium]